jgi:hypothetical protein
MQAATYIGSMAAAHSVPHILQLSMAALLLEEAAPQQRAQGAAILQAAVGLQALCLASRSVGGGSSSISGGGGGAASSGSSSGSNGSGGGSEAPSPADKLYSLSGSMLRASSAAQAAACHLLLEQPRDPVGGGLTHDTALSQWRQRCMAPWARGLPVTATGVLLGRCLARAAANSSFPLAVQLQCVARLHPSAVGAV